MSSAGKEKNFRNKDQTVNSSLAIEILSYKKCVLCSRFFRFSAIYLILDNLIL